MNLNEYINKTTVLTQIVEGIEAIESEYLFSQATEPLIEEYKVRVINSVLKLSNNEYTVEFIDSKQYVDDNNSMQMSLKIIKNRRC